MECLRDFVLSNLFALRVRHYHIAGVLMLSKLGSLGSYLRWPTSAFSLKSGSMMMSGFKEVETQFIAALGDPKASAGTGAEQWGIWRIDPGPRGVRLQNFKQLGR